ncbi:SPO22-domain-containing protein [Saccharata proteae CBS 121410]|uniref:Protein ZIP4 homolog n=1 Tax=Saccharata proteae CBS 121410 TaxID=1314787 RepID=A0A9P4M0J8_9PEZI|nr:SPO22-domain-containing protein [Saccharata proteae CBS 121410]
MGPADVSRSERAKKVTALLSFAQTLGDRIGANLTDPELNAQIQSFIQTLPLPASAAVTSKQSDFDRIGTELWNLSTRLRRDAGAEDRNSLCLLRAFSFLLLDTAQQGGRKATTGNLVRLLKVALKAARFCLDQKSHELCLRVLERAAWYEEQFSKPEVQADQESMELHGRLRAEYYILRTALAWRQSRLDIAEHMFSKSALAANRVGASTAEALADMLYEIGKDLLSKRQYELAVKWLERAYDIIGEQDLDGLSSDAGELRLSIMHNLVRALLKLDKAEERQKAADIVDLMEASYGNKMVVPLLRLELLSAKQPFDPEVYYATLDRMIRSMPLTEANFKTLMHHVHKLKSQDAMLAGKMIDRFLETRLFESENRPWIEKATITRIWISASLKDEDQSMSVVRCLLDAVAENTHGPFNAPATHAAQTLLWKRIEAAFAEKRYEVAEAWCRLTKHRLFERSGELNQAKISRKIILCALSRQDYALARSTFFDMTEQGQAAADTRYLLYKVAIREGDLEFATECLDIVCKQSSKDATLLYACVLEAQQVGDKRQAAVALQKVLQKYEYGAPQGVHLPALLRCTLRLLATQLATTDENAITTATELCKVFEGAAAQAKNTKRRSVPQAGQEFTVTELEWFSRNSYNIALKYCDTMEPELLMRLLNACIQFVELLQGNTATGEEGSLALRLLFCHFLAAAAAIVLARSADDLEVSLQNYLHARKHTQAFRTILPEQFRSAELSSSARDDLTAKHAQMIKYELEAALKSQDWTAMDPLFEAYFKQEDTQQRHLETLADLVLVIHAALVESNATSNAPHRAKILTVLQKIINLTWRHRSGSTDVAKLARWIRCLFQLSLGFDEKLSLQCIEQAKDVAQKRGTGTAADSRNQDDGYPSEELEWLATTVFNRAVDLYCANDDGGCRLWAEKALGLAVLVVDGGALHRLLQQKYSGLRWEE